MRFTGDTFANSQRRTEGKNMRASMLALAWILMCAAAAPAQTVIDVEGQRAAEPPAQDEPQTQPQTQPQPPATIEAPAQAKDDELPSPADGGRFTFSRVGNGFVRLDTRSGEVAYCRAQNADWACQSASDKQAEPAPDAVRQRADLAELKALTSEVARLQDEVASLRREIAALKEPPPPRPPAELTQPDKSGEALVKLPTQEDIARARDFIEKPWPRLAELLSGVRERMMQKG
jgi:hypothetical protein